MQFIDKMTHLKPDHKAAIAAQWSGTFADLRMLTLVGIALLRGTANPIEETAMARMCNPNKTKHLSKEQRGFLAFESTLDRACSFLKAVDPKGLSDKYDTKVDHEVPRDALIDAMSYDAMKGQTILANAYRDIQHARTIFIQVKAKYGDKLRHVGTKTLEGKERKPRKVKEADMVALIRERFQSDPARLAEESTKYILNPSTYTLPAVQVATMSAAA